MLNFGIFRGSFGYFYTLIGFLAISGGEFKIKAHAPVHENELQNQMFVLGCMLRSHSRNGNERQTSCHRHSAANIEILGF